jgi:hypothetical protein
MKFSVFMKIIAIQGLVYGIASLFFPDASSHGLGHAFTTLDLFLARSMGVLLLTVAFVNWAIRNEKMSKVVRNILWANVFMNVALAAIDIINVTSGTIESSAWFGITIHGLVTSGFLYYLLAKKQLDAS